MERSCSREREQLALLGPREREQLALLGPLCLELPLAQLLLQA